MHGSGSGSAKMMPIWPDPDSDPQHGKHVQLPAPVYVEDAVAECLEDGMEEAERGLQLQQLHHQVNADEGVSFVLLHIRQPVGQSAPFRHP